MKMVMRPQPTQLPSHLSISATSTNVFNRDLYMMMGYRSLTAKVIGGGGKGGTGGGGVKTTKKPHRPLTTGTYYSKGGGGAGGSSGGVSDVPKTPLASLPALIPATVGAAAAPSTFLGVTAPAGTTGGNGVTATANVGGAGGTPSVPPAGGDAGDPGVAGEWFDVSPTYYYWGGGDGGEGGWYFDMFTGEYHGEGGLGGEGNDTYSTGTATTKAGKPGANGKPGGVIIDLSADI